MSSPAWKSEPDAPGLWAGSDWCMFSYEWGSSTIGRRIAALMAFRGLSSRELASLVGVSHAAICNYRNCDDFPSSKVLLRVASALGVKASVLLGEIRPPKTLEQWEMDWMNAPMGPIPEDTPPAIENAEDV